MIIPQFETHPGYGQAPVPSTKPTGKQILVIGLVSFALLSAGFLVARAMR